jgi:hypothetical protein
MNEETKICQCDYPGVAPILYETDGDQYCPLPCENGGVYRRQTLDCQCTRKYNYGDLCQFTSAEEQEAEERNRARITVGSWHLWPLLYGLAALILTTIGIGLWQASEAVGSKAAKQANLDRAATRRRYTSLHSRSQRQFVGMI